MGLEALAVAIVTAVTTAAPLTFAAFEAAVFVTTIALTTAVAVGLSYAQQALAKTQTDRAGVSFGDSPAGINAPEARGNVKQATPPIRIVIGETRIGGALVAYEVSAPYIYLQFVYGFLPISEFKSLYVGEQQVSFASLTENVTVTPLDVDGQADFPNRLSVCVQKGTLAQGINTLLAASFPAFGTRFIHPGSPNAVFKCHYGADADEFISLWGNVQIPNFQWVVRGIGLPDPRIASCRLDFDPTDPEDMFHAISTWPYSNTAALAQAFWAMMPFGLNAGPDRIDWDAVAEAANFDEEIVALKDGGYQKRHTIDGIISLHDKPNVVLEAMLTANRGFVRQRAGEVSIFSSQPRDEIFTITDAMLIGGFDFRNIKPKKELVNIQRCKFIAPDREYQDADGPVLRRNDLIEEDGEEFEQSVRLPFTSTHQRAQRLMKGFVAEARLGKYLTVRTSMQAYGLAEGDIVRRYSETGRYTSQNGLYSVEEWQMADDRSSMGFALAEYDKTIARDWNPNADELPFELEVAA